MKIYFINEGKCGEANYLYKRIRSYILINGFEVVDSFEEGEMLIMNTCNSSMRITRKNQETIEKYKDKKIFIIGCGLSFEMSSGYSNVYTIPLGQESLLDAWFFVSRKIETVNSLDIRNYFYNSNESRNWTVEVSRGALHSRNYCAIGNVKGNITSKSIDDIIQEIYFAIDSGAQNIILSSDDLAGYGYDLGLNMIDLFESFLQLPHHIEITCNYIDPKYIVLHKKEFLSILKKDKRIRSVLIPTYFNTKTLKKINSGYSVEELLEVIAEIKQLGIYTHNHLIVFHPDESYQDFRENISNSDMYDCITFNPYYKKIKWDVYENNFFNNKEENLKKLKAIIYLVKTYPQKFQVEERIERLLKIT